MFLNFKHQLPAKTPRQTVQTQIRLLLKKQSDQGLPCLYSDKHFVNSIPGNQIFFLEQKEKNVPNFRTPYSVIVLCSISHNKSLKSNLLETLYLEKNIHFVLNNSHLKLQLITKCVFLVNWSHRLPILYN